MLAQRRMDYTAIEQYPRRLGNAIEDLQCRIEFIIVVVSECLHPRLDFLQQSGLNTLNSNSSTHLLQRHIYNIADVYLAQRRALLTGREEEMKGG
jgi:hypothetical protein